MVYVKCVDSDGSFDAPANIPCGLNSAIKRLSFNAQLLQTFTAESLYQHGLGRNTFRLEEDESGSPKVHVFTSKLTTSGALSMTGNQLYDTFSKGKGNSMRCHVILIHEGGGLIKTTLHSLKLMSRTPELLRYYYYYGR